ncbi:hypothetical protein BISA_0872 [Bifidobacterium saguini DSM 23967]|uniref:Uncharacterized protein n=2 Tax=Bifidobacterium saguini TaxID=762210 RepID=A0A087DAC0_9BIFI|nr:hypothetical protein [Bifidobacterium saguini]KFI92470.1 hypothetical protein BISA_0872 [Bifidobacterium saguini DSM 23967]QTB90806.1 hypothetical protein BSD967_11065 [Bifidobacterium saguini]QTB90868.1 hypothetical protein BSD967_11400 [Bifidobacterium saguini]
MTPSTITTYSRNWEPMGFDDIFEAASSARPECPAYMVVAKRNDFSLLATDLVNVCHMRMLANGTVRICTEVGCIDLEPFREDFSIVYRLRDDVLVVGFIRNVFCESDEDPDLIEDREHIPADESEVA